MPGIPWLIKAGSTSVPSGLRGPPIELRLYRRLLALLAGLFELWRLAAGCPNLGLETLESRTLQDLQCCRLLS